MFRKRNNIAHAIHSVSISTSINFSFGTSDKVIGITFTPSISNKFDTINTVQAYWSDLNW